MTDIYLTPAEKQTIASKRIVKARPLNGSLIHAIAEPRRDQKVGALGSLVFARALCGVRGQDAWGGGGMQVSGPRDDSEFGTEMQDFKPGSQRSRTICKKCSSRFKEILKEREGLFE
ncbi:hypothetical protein SEA_MACGULLY_77 [Rhodococcus phage MacGully]|nr:hypothetical protein SEA_MACGULLY_77 [Rhodococcus phage MacGully]